MKNLTIKPIQQSRTFTPSQLFFSTTDKKGVITRCNDIFIEISAFSPKQLLGKPHNIIRHPDMPRCAFQLVWNFILSGKPVGAYVKNLAATGEYYWVFALVLPIDNGFLSIRLKPTSDLLKTVESLYKKLLECENNTEGSPKLAMEKSSQVLIKALIELGFESYEAFMAFALREEIRSRTKALQSTSTIETPTNSFHSVFNQIEELTDLKNNILDRKVYFNNLSYTIKRLSTNASVVAASLTDEGRALGVISVEVSQLAHQIASEVDTLSTQINLLGEKLHDTSFYVTTCLLILEMKTFFQEGMSQSDLSEEEQKQTFGDTFENLKDLLSDCLYEAQSKCNLNVTHLKEALTQFQFLNDALSKILLNLRLGYVTGLSISASLKEGKRFSLLLDEIHDSSLEAREELKLLIDSVRSVNHLIGQWEKDEVFA